MNNSIPLVTQLEFTRQEFRRVMNGVNSDSGERVLPPFNSLSYIVAHMAVHEHTMWIVCGQEERLFPEIDQFRSGSEALVPSWNLVWEQWEQITLASSAFLHQLSTNDLYSCLQHPTSDTPLQEVLGHTLLRVIFHYWFHLGEAHGIRQAMGHENLPEFVGKLDQTIF